MPALGIVALQTPASKSTVSQVRTVKRLQPARDQRVLLQLETLEKRLFKKAESWTGIFSREVVRRNTVLLYVSSGDETQVIAYIVYSTNGLAAHIAKLAVRDDVRRQGLGRTLVKAALDIAAKERRVSSCSLHVDATNTPALQLYTSLGFTAESEVPDYYAAGRSALRMRLELAPELQQ